jgi:hypothetical protein
MNFLQAAGKFFRRLWARRAPVSVRALTPVQAARLLSLAESASEEEFSCDEVYALVDQYAECVARGEDAAALMPLVKEHLQRCAGCQEELEALLRMIKT